MEYGLGRFGERRLEKGGPFYWPVLLRWVGASCGCASWAVAGRGRFA